MLDYYDLKRLKSYAFAVCNGELVDKVNTEIITNDLLGDLETLIKLKYSQGYNYLDIARDFRNKGNYVIINDDVYLVFVENLVIIFQASTFDIFKK